jgi:predicted RNA-binding protein Jag
LKEALGINESDEKTTGFFDNTELALDEVKTAIRQLESGADSIELKPQNQQIRKLQHELVEQHNLTSESIGDGNDRHLKILKLKSVG